MKLLAGNATLLYYMSEEAQEGKRAYLERRKPDFSKFPRRPWRSTPAPIAGTTTGSKVSSETQSTSRSRPRFKVSAYQSPSLVVDGGGRGSGFTFRRVLGAAEREHLLLAFCFSSNSINTVLRLVGDGAAQISKLGLLDRRPVAIWVAGIPRRMTDKLKTAPKRRRRWRDYRTAAGGRPVRDFLDTLTDEELAEVVAAMKDVAAEGLSAAKHLRGDIYEVKADAATRSFRVLFSAEGRFSQVLLSLSAFTKKTQKTPQQELELAENRRDEWRARGKRRKSRGL